MRAKLGQNFLTSGLIAEKIVNSACLAKNDTVLEIGPGKGILTAELLKAAGKVIAVEKDPRLCESLEEKFSDTLASADPKLEIINDDIRDYLHSNSFKKLKKYKIVANIPYYLTSRLLKILLGEIKNYPQSITLMIQKEVAQRIVARAPDANLLALSVQAYGDPKINFLVSKKYFSPAPKVDSAVITIDSISQNFFTKNKIEEKKFFSTLKAGFAHKRKFLLRNLEKTLKISHEKLARTFSAVGLDEKSRAENLSLDDWAKLVKIISK